MTPMQNAILARVNAPISLHQHTLTVLTSSFHNWVRSLVLVVAQLVTPWLLVEIVFWEGSCQAWMIQIGGNLSFGSWVSTRNCISTTCLVMSMRIGVLTVWRKHLWVADWRLHVARVALWSEVVVDFAVNRFVYLGQAKTSLVVLVSFQLLLLSKSQHTFVVWSNHVDLSMVRLRWGLISAWTPILVILSILTSNTSQSFFADIFHVFIVRDHWMICSTTQVNSLSPLTSSLRQLVLDWVLVGHHHLWTHIWKCLSFALIQICAQFMQAFQSFSPFYKRSLLPITLLTAQILVVTAVDGRTSWQAVYVLLFVGSYAHDLRLIHIRLSLKDPSLFYQIQFRLWFKLLLTTQLSKSGGRIYAHNWRFRLVVLVLLWLEKVVSTISVRSSRRNASWCNLRPIWHHSRIDPLHWLNRLGRCLLIAICSIATHLSTSWQRCSFVVLLTGVVRECINLLGLLLDLLVSLHFIAGSLLRILLVDKSV